MNIEEAINKCKSIVKVNNDFLKDRKQTINQEEIQAIDTVLKELDNRIPREKIEKYRQEFIDDSKNENVFMTQSSQINASLIQFCNKLLNKE